MLELHLPISCDVTTQNLAEGLGELGAAIGVEGGMDGMDPTGMDMAIGEFAQVEPLQLPVLLALDQLGAARHVQFDLIALTLMVRRSTVKLTRIWFV